MVGAPLKAGTRTRSVAPPRLTACVEGFNSLALAPCCAKYIWRSANGIAKRSIPRFVIDAFSASLYSVDSAISSKCAVMLASEGRPLISRYA